MERRRLFTEIQELELDLRARKRVLRDKRARLAQLPDHSSGDKLVPRSTVVDHRPTLENAERQVRRLRSLVYAFNKTAARELDEPARPIRKGKPEAEYRRLKYHYDKARLEWLLDEERRLQIEVDKNEALASEEMLDLLLELE